ncbi:MAG: putative sugar nucleotidyl transferase [Aigarchaeota archaeon]|nr:putative sugar nucleotidyl transferase [Aigarchaeota archaeon]MCX8192289.1 putative sugar nucleotidyl transferase [Nitrososphaeria archaeon]MDW7986103.1 putative sugar nucleotidyl transferase [Nitrososphaerota archaeon]
MHLAIFEDECYWNFFPLTLTRPVYEMRVGTSCFREKILAKIRVEGEVILFTRTYLEEVQKERTPQLKVNEFSLKEDVLLINGLVLPDEKLSKLLEKLSRPGIVIVKDGRIVAARFKSEVFSSPSFREVALSADNISRLLLSLASEKLQINDINLIEYPWELIELNSKLISVELERFKGREWEGEMDNSVIIYGDKQNLYLARGAFIEGYTVLDLRSGPIYVGENTHIQSFTHISGPVYIGRDCVIFGGQIRSGCSIGDVCRVGGEVEETIFHGYSNKRHYGFIGHSYIGEWVNLGAGTTNSNLKNTYGTIRIEINGRRCDTGRTFIGAFIGDHVKSAIGTYIFSGKRIGVSSHLYGVVSEDVPSFTTYARRLGVKLTEIYLESAIEVAKRVMSRRGINISRSYEDMLRKVFEITEQDRLKAQVSKERLSI